MWPLMMLLCTFTATASAFLDNVTTMLLMAPVTMELFQVLELDPVIALLAEVMFSNLGGTSTPVGDPPNVMITAHKTMRDNGMDFMSFTFMMAPGVVIASVVAMYQFKRKFIKFALAKTKATMTNELNVWKSTYRSLEESTPEDIEVKESIFKYVRDFARKIMVMFLTLVDYI